MAVDWQTVLISSGVTAPLLFLVAWRLTLRLVDNRLKQDLESHKGALATQLEEEKARLAKETAAQLQAVRTEAEILLEDLRSSKRRQEAHLTKLDEQRASIIANVYAGVVRARMEMRAVLRPDQALDGRDQDAATQAREKLETVRLYFAEHEIFFHKESGKAIGEWIRSADAILFRLAQPVKPQDYKDIQERLEAAQHGYGTLDNIHTLLARELRMLLGIEDGPLGKNVRYLGDNSAPVDAADDESMA